MNNISAKTLKGCCRELAGSWAKCASNKIYQSVNARLISAIENMEFLSGCNILDIGSNQGLHSIYAAQFAKSVTGIEVAKAPYNRSLLTYKWFEKNKYKHLSKVRFVHEELCNFNDYKNIDAILSCCVVYNMSHENVQKFVDILKQCDKLIYQTRPSAAKRTSGRSSYNMCEVNDVVSNLQRWGFEISDITHLKSRWPVIYARRS